jgi:hypothetical protein
VVAVGDIDLDRLKSKIMIGANLVAVMAIDQDVMTGADRQTLEPRNHRQIDAIALGD